MLELTNPDREGQSRESRERKEGITNRKSMIYAKR